MGVFAYLRNTLRKGSSNNKRKEGSLRRNGRRDSYYYASSSATNSRTRHFDCDTTDEDMDGWDFGARQTPDRSMHSTTPSSFAASRILLPGAGDTSRSSSAQSCHPTKPKAEAKLLPPTPTDFEAEIEFYRRGADYIPGTSNLQQIASTEMASKTGRIDAASVGAISAPGRSLPQEGIVLVAAATIAKETRLVVETAAQRRKRAQSVGAPASSSEPSRPVLRHMSSAYTVQDAERRAYGPEGSMGGPSLHTGSSSSSSGSSSASTVQPVPAESCSSSLSSTSTSSPSSSPADVRVLGGSYKPRRTAALQAKRSMPQLEGVWEHFLEETAEDVTALHAKGDADPASAPRPPIRQSSKQNLLEDSSSGQPWRSDSSPVRVSRPPLPRHSSCPSTSSNLTIASVSSSKYSPSLSSLEMQEIMDSPRSPSTTAITTTPTAIPSQRTIHQRRKHRSSNLMRISNPTSLSSTSSMAGSSFTSMGFSIDRASVSTMTTVQDDDEVDKLDAQDDEETRPSTRNTDGDLFSTPDQRLPRRFPKDLRIIPELYARSKEASSHQHQSSQSCIRQMRNGVPSPSSALSFASHASSSPSSSNPNAGRCYMRGPGSSTTCESEGSPVLTPVGTPTPTTANFPITPPLSRSSSRSTPQLRQRKPSTASQGGHGQSMSPAAASAARNAVVWQRTPPLYTRELPVAGDGDDFDDIDTMYFGFPRTPNSSAILLPKLLSSSSGKRSCGNSVQIQRHTHRPSISDSSSEEQHSELSYLHPTQPQPRKEVRNIRNLRSKSSTNLRSPPAALEDQNSMFTQRVPVHHHDRPPMRHPPLPPLPVSSSNVLQFDATSPQSFGPQHVHAPRPPSRRTRSDSDAMTPYSTTSPSNPSPRSSPLRHPIDLSRLAQPMSGSPARPSPKRSPLSRSVDLPPQTFESAGPAPGATANARRAGKPVEWGYAV